MSLARVLEPAIELAEEGFLVTQTFHDRVAREPRGLRPLPDDGGGVPSEGSASRGRDDLPPTGLRANASAGRGAGRPGLLRRGARPSNRRVLREGGRDSDGGRPRRLPGEMGRADLDLLPGVHHRDPASQQQRGRPPRRAQHHGGVRLEGPRTQHRAVSPSLHGSGPSGSRRSKPLCRRHGCRARSARSPPVRRVRSAPASAYRTGQSFPGAQSRRSHERARRRHDASHGDGRRGQRGRADPDPRGQLRVEARRGRYRPLLQQSDAAYASRAREAHPRSGAE